MTPDSSKSQIDRTKEAVTDLGDRAAANMQSDSSKSTSQSMFDKTRREKDTHSSGGKPDTVGDKIKKAVGLDK